MSLLDYKAMYVNLSHRADRNSRMIGELARVGVSAERFEAMRPEAWVGDPRRVAMMRNRTPGAIGCLMSQVRVMHAARDAGKHAMVLEDDVVFADDFQDRLKIMADFCEKIGDENWAVFWLGGTCHRDRTWAARNGTVNDMVNIGHDRIVRTYGTFSTHGYIVNIRYINQVIGLINDHLHETIGIDNSMIFWVQPVLPCFAFIPGSLFQIDNRSDIGIMPDGSPGFTTFSHFPAGLGQHCWKPKSMNDFNAAEFIATLPKQ